MTRTFMPVAVRIGIAGLAMLVFAIAPRRAAAQSDDAGDEVELTEDPPTSDPEGTEENPDAPKIGGATEVQTPTPDAPTRASGYHLQEALRPITLLRGMSEIALDLRANFEETGGATLRARYGIDRRWQIGLRYAAAGFFDDGKQISFKTGKTIAIDGTFLIFDWMAAQISLPIYLDPFAMGVVLGAPMKFRIGETLAFYALSDVVEIKLDGFVPSLISEASNFVRAQELDSGTIHEDGVLRFSGGAIYQTSPRLAVIGYIASELHDFRTIGIGYPFDVTLQYTVTPSVDLAARIGFDDLADADTFGLRLTAAFRI